jgi:hypothetical protein
LIFNALLKRSSKLLKKVDFSEKVSNMMSKLVT